MGTEGAGIGATADGEIEHGSQKPNAEAPVPKIKIDIPSDVVTQLLQNGGFLQVNCTLRIV